MKNRLLVVLAVSLVLAVWVTGAWAISLDPSPASRVPAPNRAASTSDELRGARLDTLWIFEADFEDLGDPDNQGWIAYDMSGTLGSTNYWHRDTIRINGFTHLGDWTWWCGMYNECWIQDRGYGNEWMMFLYRDFPLSTWSITGDAVNLEFDQRFAMELQYDYGYVDVSTDGGNTFDTVISYTNPGFPGTPGGSRDWDDATYGHQSLDLSSYAGQDVRLRFRFDSDAAYSSQDQYPNPPSNSVVDGAWQIDNIEWKVNDAQVWIDDVESGDNGWNHDDMVAAGQKNIVFERKLYGSDIWTNRDFTCEDRTGWMYAAVDEFTSRTIDGMASYLISPPIDISGATKLVGLWDMWVDLPQPSENRFDLWLASNDQKACVQALDGFQDEAPGGWYGGPFWGVWDDDWNAFAGNDWLAIEWQLENTDPAAANTHYGGIFLTRQLVGIPSGDVGTIIERDDWNSFHDWFVEQLAEATVDSCEVLIKDDDGIASANIVASNDGGTTWSSYPMRHESAESDTWIGPPPVAEMTVGSRIIYYIEAIDGVGTITTLPEDAPDRGYEMSILPIVGDTADPGILLVDKHQRATPGESRYGDVYHASEYYYTEMLGILGYEYDKFDVDVESATNEQSHGPDSVGYKYYDTQIWFANEFDSFVIEPFDQNNLVNWLTKASEGKERNLLLTGNDIGKELMETGTETLGFFETWLACDYVENAVGVVTTDSCPTLVDNAGGFDFMTAGSPLLRGACPTINYFDVIQPRSGVTGNETVADYQKIDMSKRPAGVAYTHPTNGYQTVMLGFGMEFMMDSMLPSGYYLTGVDYRVDMMDNIMTYFGLTPGTGTDVGEGGAKNMLSHAYPNPFNPVTEIAYSIKEAGPVTIEVYNVAGKVVRTLLSSELDAGASGVARWDGTDEYGEKCASGVYFYRLDAPGFTESQKMVMLK